MTALQVIGVDADDQAVRDLLLAHLRFCREVTPAEAVFAFDLDAYADPAVELFGAYTGDALLGVGALRRLDGRSVEIKSMHTAAAARGTGVARSLLRHLLDVAVDRDYAAVYLETGTSAAFEPARALYRSEGFVPSRPFGGHRPSAHNTYFVLAVGKPAG